MLKLYLSSLACTSLPACCVVFCFLLVDRGQILILLRAVFHVLTAAIQDDPANKNFMDEVLPVLIYFFLIYIFLKFISSVISIWFNFIQLNKHLSFAVNHCKSEEVHVEDKTRS